MPLNALQVRAGDCWCLSVTHTHTHTHISHPLVRTLKFDWWGNRWQIAVSILMDDIIWPNVLITYAKTGAWLAHTPSLRSPFFCLQLISGSLVHQPPLNLMHEEGRAVDAALYSSSRSLGPPPLPHPSLSRGVRAVTDPVALCLFTLIRRRSLCVKRPFCF